MTLLENDTRLRRHLSPLAAPPSLEDDVGSSLPIANFVQTTTTTVSSGHNEHVRGLSRRDTADITLHENVKTRRRLIALPPAPPLEANHHLSHSIPSSVQTTGASLDSGYHYRVRGLSRRTREVEMANDELRHRLPTIAPGPPSRALPTVETIPHPPAIAPRGGITHVNSVSIVLFRFLFMLLSFSQSRTALPLARSSHLSLPERHRLNLMNVRCPYCGA